MCRANYKLVLRALERERESEKKSCDRRDFEGWSWMGETCMKLEAWNWSVQKMIKHVCESYLLWQKYCADRRNRRRNRRRKHEKAYTRKLLYIYPSMKGQLLQHCKQVKQSNGYNFLAVKSRSMWRNWPKVSSLLDSAGATINLFHQGTASSESNAWMSTSTKGWDGSDSPNQCVLEWTEPILCARRNFVECSPSDKDGKRSEKKATQTRSRNQCAIRHSHGDRFMKLAAAIVLWMFSYYVLHNLFHQTFQCVHNMNKISYDIINKCLIYSLHWLCSMWW